MEAALAHPAPADDLVPVRVRPLAAADIPAFLGLVDALADALGLARPDAGARDRLTRDALADPRRVWVRLAERAGRAVGHAAYLETYSTFLARPTLCLEDLFVLPAERRYGVGRVLMAALR